MTSGFRKPSDPSYERMRTRTAKEQLARALADANRPQEEAVPEVADDEFYKPNNERPT